jgi:hypothetical protein
VAIGVSATLLSGEWPASWEYVLVDVSEALAMCALGAWVAGRGRVRRLD